MDEPSHLKQTITAIAVAVLLIALLGVLPGCAGRHAPPPDPVPTPLPTPTPEPTPEVGCADIPNEGAVAVSPRPDPDKDIADAVNAALRRLFPECSVNSRCLINEGRASFFDKLTEEIRRGGPGIPPICAGVQAGADQICVGTSQRCQGHHSYTCVVSTGCATGVVGWAPGSYANRDGDTWVRP